MQSYQGYQEEETASKPKLSFGFETASWRLSTTALHYHFPWLDKHYLKTHSTFCSASFLVLAPK